jgi:cell division protein FtsZ
MSQMGMGMMGSGRSSGDNRATEAAQAAVASPLLEDVNLSGAKGILVNVTGANMTLGEFQDIGDVISSFASEDATVVMGTAIDEMLDDQIRVTVVATGLGHPYVQQVAPSKPKVVKADGELDLVELDKPTVMRRQERQQAPDEYDEELLDIPAFLRRQAD